MWNITLQLTNVTADHECTSTNEAASIYRRSSSNRSSDPSGVAPLKAGSEFPICFFCGGPRRQRPKVPQSSPLFMRKSIASWITAKHARAKTVTHSLIKKKAAWIPSIPPSEKNFSGFAVRPNSRRKKDFERRQRLFSDPTLGLREKLFLFLRKQRTGDPEEILRHSNVSPDLSETGNEENRTL